MGWTFVFENNKIFIVVGFALGGGVAPLFSATLVYCMFNMQYWALHRKEHGQWSLLRFLPWTEDYTWIYCSLNVFGSVPRVVTTVKIRKNAPNLALLAILNGKLSPTSRRPVPIFLGNCRLKKDTGLEKSSKSNVALNTPPWILPIICKCNICLSHQIYPSLLRHLLSRQRDENCFISNLWVPPERHKAWLLLYVFLPFIKHHGHRSRIWKRSVQK